MIQAPNIGCLRVMTDRRVTQNKRTLVAGVFKYNEVKIDRFGLNMDGKRAFSQVFYFSHT
jgi:hypothetical protein